MRVLGLSGSLRRDSLNKKLLETIAQILRSEKGLAVDTPEFREFYCPPYDGDLEENVGIPYAATRLARRLSGSDAVVLVSPEYNHSIPGTLKNLVDWSSRIEPNPWRRKPVLLASASPSKNGGSRGLKHLKQVLSACGAKVNPQTYSLPHAGRLLADGLIMDARFRRELDELVRRFIRANRTQGSRLARRSIYDVSAA